MEEVPGPTRQALKAFIERKVKDVGAGDGRKKPQVRAAAKAFVKEAGGDVSNDSAQTKRISRALTTAYGNPRRGPKRTGVDHTKQLEKMIKSRGWIRLKKSDLDIESRDRAFTERACHVMARPSIKWHLGNTLMVLLLNATFSVTAAENFRAAALQSEHSRSMGGRGASGRRRRRWPWARPR